MFSRITRLIHRNERNRPIDRTRKKEITALTIYLMAFISLLSFFFLGYLYRPYLNFNQYIFIALLIAFYLLRRPRASAPLTIILGISVLLTFVVAKVSGIDLFYLKGALILSTALFATDNAWDLVPYEFGKGALLYLQWQTFALGLFLSNIVHEGKVKTQNQKIEAEDIMIVKILFSLISLFSTYMVALGIKILTKNKPKREPKEQQYQFLQIILNGIMLIAAFSYQHQAQLSINQKIIAVFIPVVVVAVVGFLQEMQRMWMIGVAIGCASFLMEIFIENDQYFIDALQILKLGSVHLLVLDGFWRWNKKTATTSDQPSFMLPVWFVTFCCCWLWGLGHYLYPLSPIIVQLSCFAAFGILLLLDWKKQRKGYEIIP